jgi:hypothetical protein
MKLDSNLINESLNMKELDLKMINECGVVENPMLIKA